ncbi:MAG: precorrin-6y C5,15-methyltransferase (decarboxylating) subunit CbiE [Alphaproteobacteria bacterium]
MMEPIKATIPWLSIIGLGEDGLTGLSPAAQALLATAETIVGGPRHFALLQDFLDRPDVEQLIWKNPFIKTVEDIRVRRGRRVAVVASGDPMHYGAGVTLARYFPGEALVLPTIGSVTLACARLGWPVSDVEVVTVHGRPLERILLHVTPGARLLVLSEDAETPKKLAHLLTEHRYGPSTLTVFERLGGPKERCIEDSAECWNAPPGDDLNLVAVTCTAMPKTHVLSRVSGLPDDAFIHDGQLTKREVRAATIAALKPMPEQILWDIGAGCGSIAIEWMRAPGRPKAIAIEQDKDRAALIAKNAMHMGVPDLKIIVDPVPKALRDLPAPHAIFIGGGITTTDLIRNCWDALQPSGRLVANVVTAEGETILLSACEAWGGTMARLAISRLEPLGGFRSWRPLLPVTQWMVRKP